MAVNADEDTEFNDALRKHGILPPKTPPPKTPSPPPSPDLEELLDAMPTSVLHDISSSLNPSASDETERSVENAIRRRKVAEREEQRKGRFGRVLPIGREDWTREVTEASRRDKHGEEDGEGTPVVCFLYKDGIQRSEVATPQIASLASKYPRTKFVSIVGDKAIENLPDVRIPFIIVYKGGDVRTQMVAWAGSQEELERRLFACGAITPSSLPSDRKRADSDDEEGDDSDGPSSRMRSATTGTNRTFGKNVRSGKTGDDDDFEFDL